MKLSRCQYGTLFVAVIFSLLPVLPAHAGTLTVNSTADDGTGTCTTSGCTLRDATLTAVSGDTITFSLPANSAITLTSGELLINKDLTINGPGADLLTVQRSSASGTAASRIFEIAANRNVTISGLTISNGKVNNAAGGGILNAGTLTLNNLAVSGNTADLSGNGAGIYNNFGTLSINNSTISGNLVGNSFGAGSGGGIYNQGGTLTITNSTLAGNKAVAAGGGTDSGGGIITNVGTVNLTNATIAGNMADAGGGVWNLNGGSVTSIDTIIARNTASSGPDIDGTLTSQGFNLIGDRSGANITPAQSSDEIGTAGAPLDPRLGVLQNNGGPTDTLALMNDSPAIDAGYDAVAPPTDQRGVLRSGTSDIGAFEFIGSLPPLQITSVSRNGNNLYVEFAEVIATRHYGLERKYQLSDPMWHQIPEVPDYTPTEPGSFVIIQVDAFSQVPPVFYRVSLVP